MSLANKGRSRQIPDRCLACAGIEEQVIGLAVAIKVRHTNYSPTSRKSGSEGAGDKSIVVQVPDRRLARADIVKKIIGLPVAVEVVERSWRSLRHRQGGRGSIERLREQPVRVVDNTWQSHDISVVDFQIIPSVIMRSFDAVRQNCCGIARRTIGGVATGGV